MPELVNWQLLKEPLNWAIVALMLAIAVFGINLMMQGTSSPLTMLTGSSGEGGAP